jgi:hypothetical protein
VIFLFSSSCLQIITKPMDFSTILVEKMQGKDGTKYSSVREICSDVRLIFTNAMEFYDEQNDIHIKGEASREGRQGRLYYKQ